MDLLRERQEDDFQEDILLLQRRGLMTDGEDVEEGGRIEVGVAEFGPPGEGGPDV